MYRLFLIAGLLILLYFLLRSAIKQLRSIDSGIASADKGQDGNQMVQDPVCRVFVPRSEAVREEVGGQTYFFCSRGCAKAFQKQLSS